MARSSFEPDPAGPPSRRTSGAAWTGIGLVLAGAAMLAALAGADPTPVSPRLPPAAQPAAIWRRLASLSGIQGSTSWTKGVLALTCAVLLGAGFLLVASEAWRGRVSTRSVVGLAIGLHVLAVALPVLGSNDVFIYGLYGRILGVHGVNPFTTVPAAFRSDPIYAYVDPQWAHTPPVYGPAFLWLAAAVARLAPTPAQIALGFKLVAAAASLATLALTVRLVDRTAPRRTAFAAAFVGTNPATAFVAVAGGHVDVLLGVAIAGALLLVRPAASAEGSRRPFVATGLLAAAALVKFVAVLPLAILAVADVASADRGVRGRRAAGHAGLAVAIALVGYLPFAQRHDLTFGLTYLFPFASLVAPMMAVHSVVASIVEMWFGRDAATLATTGVRLAFGAAFALGVARIGRMVGSARDEDRFERILSGCAWALVLVTLSFQWLYPWYVAWFAPVVWMAPRRVRAAALAMCAALPLSTVIVNGDAAPSIARGVARLCTLVIAPALLVVLAALLGTLFRGQRTTEAEPIGLVPRAAKG